MSDSMKNAGKAKCKFFDFLFPCTIGSFAAIIYVYIYVYIYIYMHYIVIIYICIYML